MGNADLAVGEVFARVYRIEGVLRSDASSALYRAQHAHTGARVTLEVVHGDVRNKPDVAARFLREATSVAHLATEALIVPKHAAIDDQRGSAYFQLDPLDGEELAQRLDRGALPYEQARDVVSQLARALSIVHRAGVVHGELGPERVFLAPSVRLLGVGTARAITQLRAHLGATSAMELPLFTPPERTDANAKVAPSADVWSLGLIAFRAFTGKHYWREVYRGGGNMMQILNEVIAKPLVAASERAAELKVTTPLPPGFDGWFARCVDRDPQRRFGDGGEAGAAFDALFGGPSNALAPINAAATVVSPMATVLPQQAYGPTPQAYVAPPTPQAAAGTGTVVAGVEAYLPPEIAASRAAQARAGSGTMLAPDLEPTMGPPPRAAAPTPVFPAPAMRVASTPGIPTSPRDRLSNDRVRGAGGGGRAIAIAVLSILAVGFGALVVFQLTAGKPPPPVAPIAIEGDPTTHDPDHEKGVGVDALNGWVAIEPASWLLGVDDESASPVLRGFRPSRAIKTPSARFELQQHEVTWRELETFFADHPSQKFDPPIGVPSDASKRAKFPASAVSFGVATAYCKSIGGALPTEGQWELAARGRDRSRFPWGDDALDLSATHVFAGASPTLEEVMSNGQDQTLGHGDKDAIVYDLIGNVQEWTSDDFRDDFAGTDESWADGFHALRGLPLSDEPFPATLDAASAAYREPACGSAACAGPDDGTPTPPLISVRVSFTGGSESSTSPFFELTQSSATKIELGKCFAADPLAKVGEANALLGALTSSSGLTTLTTASDPSLRNRAVTATPCAKSTLENKLSELTAEKGEPWTASVMVTSLRARAPRSFAFVGFRCARSAK